MTTTLEAPVTVLAGLGLQRELRTLFDLLDFLNEWPSGRRGPIYLAAYRACTAALAGQLDCEQARQAFISFVRLSNLLVGAGDLSPIQTISPSIGTPAGAGLGASQ